MMRTLVSGLFALFSFLLLSFSAASTSAAGPGADLLGPDERAWLKAHPVIRLAPDPEFRPIEYFDKDGTYKGAAADIIRLVEQRLGIHITIVHLKNWDEVMEKFRNREVDVLGAMVRTPAREKFALFTETLVAVPGGIFSGPSGPASLTLDELKGRKVAVVSNYTAHDVLRTRFPEIQLDVVPDVSTGLAKASLGMVDAYVENMANATWYAQEAGITNVHLAGKTDFAYEWGIGVRKDWPEFRDILNKGLAAVSTEEREEALSRWIRISGAQWRPSRALLIGAAASGLGILLIAILIWNLSLRRVVRVRTESLRQELAERQRTEAALQELAGKLEHRVRDRTADLEKEISVRLQAEKTALANEERFRSLFDSASDPMYIADQTGKIIAANEQASRELGYTAEEMLQLRVVDIDSGGRQEEVQERLEVLKEGKPAIFETVHTRKDGSVLAVEVKAHQIDYGGMPAVLGTARDLTQRKKREEENRRLEQQMMHAQKLESLGVLAGGIAHDFNNILMAVIGNADLALMRLSPESPVVEPLRTIEQAAARAADLARQMLAYSGKGRFVVEAIDLNSLIREMTHMLEVSISKKAILRYNFGTPLPAIDGDATQVRQIVMNLVINASEAIGDKSGIIAITTGCMECDSAYLKEAWLDESLAAGIYVFVEVADTGCGMDKETASRVFDPFFTTKFTGRGLGMAAVLGIVRGHKGTIKVYSEVGKGSTFKILFPASQDTAKFFGDGDVASDWTGKGTVLLVDDEESVRAVGAEMLRALGYEVLTATDGRDALERFREKPDVSCVILDLTMPHMDGEQTYRELRKIKEDVRIIMSSGYNEQEVTQRFVGRGLAGFIQKPYRLATLRAVLQKGESACDPAPSEKEPAT